MHLYLTALALGTNALHAFLKHANVYGLAFATLTLTSLLFHTCPKDDSLYSQTLFWLDQIAIYAVVLIGAYYALQTPMFQLIPAIIGFCICIIYYHYGRLTQQFCWDPQFASLYHGYMHIAGSLGHHAIMLGIA